MDRNNSVGNRNNDIPSNLSYTQFNPKFNSKSRNRKHINITKQLTQKITKDWIKSDIGQSKSFKRLVAKGNN